MKCPFHEVSIHEVSVPRSGSHEMGHTKCPSRSVPSTKWVSRSGHHEMDFHEVSIRLNSENFDQNLTMPDRKSWKKNKATLLQLIKTEHQQWTKSQRSKQIEDFFRWIPLNFNRLHLNQNIIDTTNLWLQTMQNRCGYFGSEKVWEKNQFELQFNFEKEIARGTFGEIQLHKRKDASDEFAVAVKKVEIDTEAKLMSALKELIIGASLRNDHLLPILNFFCDDRDRMFLIMEYINGDDLTGWDKLELNTIASIMRQMAKALDYLHNTCKIIHRDVKLDNILMDKNGKVYLMDFGGAKFDFDPLHTLKDLNHLTGGTLIYIPPERLNRRAYDYKVDIWALGIAFYILLVGNEPFLELESQGTIVWIANTTANMAEKRWENCEFLNQYPKGVHDLLGKLLEPEAQNRITAAELGNDPFCSLVN